LWHFCLCQKGFVYGVWCHCNFYYMTVYKGNNKITELRTILQRESQNS
jgi:hypothetical protein